jgi:hypothetical protein
VIAILVGSLAVLAAAAMCLIFSEGFVRWHQQADLAVRFPDAWPAYRTNVGSLGPRGLRLEDATRHPQGFPARAAYRHPTGFEEHGIAAIARCLEHVHLGWAFLGWFMRLPGLRRFLQVLLDGTGEQSPRARGGAPRSRPPA